jgi:hypothetical protein
LSNNPISDYLKLAKSLSTIPNLNELRLDLTTVEKVEIVLRNLPNLKKLNDKEIKPDLFYEDNIEENNNEIGSNENIENEQINNNNNNINNNDKIIIEKKEIEGKDIYTSDIELPDSNIESEISNYDVSYILFKFNYISK